MQRINVVLPLPLGPSRPVTLPRGTVQFRPCRTWRLPRWTKRSLTSIAVSMTPPSRDGGTRVGIQQLLKSTVDDIRRLAQVRSLHDHGLSVGTPALAIAPWARDAAVTRPE